MAQIKGIHSFSGYNGGSFATKTYRTSLLSEQLPLFRLFKQYSLCDETFHMRQASQSEPADCGNVQRTCESDRNIPFHRSRPMQKYNCGRQLVFCPDEKTAIVCHQVQLLSVSRLQPFDER